MWGSYRHPEPDPDTASAGLRRVALGQPNCELTLSRGGETLSLRSSRAAFEIVGDRAPPGVEPAL